MVDLIEFGSLTAEQYAELVGDERDPWESGDVVIEWRDKDRHVGVRAPDGRMLAAAGLVLADVQFGERPPTPVVGLGGVIVTAPYRGRGLGRQVISEAIKRAEGLGPDLAMLFCREDRAGLYQRHGFLAVHGPVLAEQAGGLIEMPAVTMWRPLKRGAALPEGAVRVHGLPF